MGRPRSVMTKAVVESIVRTVALGISVNTAAKIHGATPSAVKSMRQRHPEFATALEKAEAEAKGGIHGKMLRHMDSQWTACAWMLERRWPEEYGKRDIDVNKSLQEMAQQLRTFMAEARKQDIAEGEEKDSGGKGDGS